MTPADAPREAGRELDALIAEKVMGLDPASFLYHAVQREGGDLRASFGRGEWTLDEATNRCARENARSIYSNYHPEVDNVEHYSTDIAAAWLVVERMNTGTDQDWWARWVSEVPDLFTLSARDAAHAICRAALAARTPQGET